MNLKIFIKKESSFWFLDGNQVKNINNSYTWFQFEICSEVRTYACSHWLSVLDKTLFDQQWNFRRLIVSKLFPGWDQWRSTENKFLTNFSQKFYFVDSYPFCKENANYILPATIIHWYPRMAQFENLQYSFSDKYGQKRSLIYILNETFWSRTNLKQGSSKTVSMESMKTSSNLTMAVDAILFVIESAPWFQQMLKKKC